MDEQRDVPRHLQLEELGFGERDFQEEVFGRDLAYDLGPQVDHAQLFVHIRRRHADLHIAQEHQFRIGQGNHHPQPRLDEPRLRAPTEFGNRPDDKATRAGWEDLAQLVQNLRGGGDRIGGEQKLPHHAILQPVAQGGAVERPFNGQNAAEAGQGEAEAKLDLRGKAHADHDDHVERVGAQQADGRDADLQHLKLKDPAIFLFHLVIAQIAAAGDRRGFQPQPRARGDFRADIGGRAIVPADGNPAAFDHAGKDIAQLARHGDDDVDAVLAVGIVLRGLFDGELPQFQPRPGKAHGQDQPLVLARAEGQPVLGVQRDRHLIGVGGGGLTGHDLFKELVIPKTRLQLGLEGDAGLEFGLVGKERHQ